MSKMSPDLAAYFDVWKQNRDKQVPTVGDELISIDVVYEGNVALLRGAGMETGLDRNGKVSGLILLSRLSELEALPNVIYIRKEREGGALLDGTIPEIRVPWKLAPATPGGRGAGVIVAIIDSGIDIAHESFLEGPNRSRILELWDQGATSGGSPPSAPYSTTRGRIFNRTQIEAMLTQRAAERLAGTALTPFATLDVDGHGTHVAGIAAGNGRQDDRCSGPGKYVGVAPQAHLVIVKYLGVTNNNFREAIDWCREAQTRHTPNRPVVINLSLHTGLTGPHDETDDDASEIDDVLLNAAGGIPRGVAVVCAAGNQGRTNHHESGTTAAGATTTLPFTIYRRDDEFRETVTRTANPVMDVAWLEVWYDGTATFDITLTAPPKPSVAGGNTVGPISPAPGSQSGTIGGMSVSIQSATIPLATHGNRKRIAVTITANSRLVLRSGSWSISLTETSGNAANWHVWGQTKRWDPSFATDSDTDADLARRRAFTVVTPSCARSVITVANYKDIDELNESSSWGAFPIPTTTPVGEVKPTLTAPGTSVAAPFGEDSTKHDRNSSCCDQKVVDLSGTSMASPHIAGVVALMFEKNPSLTFEDIREVLQRDATIADIPSGEIPPVYPNGANPHNIHANHIWGSGRVDASAAIDRVPVPIGGGSGGGPTIIIEEPGWGYTPHTIFSRLAEIQHHIGNRPGLGLAASLISAHVDETLYLIQHNRKVGAVWQRYGGPALVRNLLHWRSPLSTMIPREVQQFHIHELFVHFLPLLKRFAGDQLRADIQRYGAFAEKWPGSDWDALDRAALALRKDQ